MNNWNKIINPKTGSKVSIYSKTGKNILNNYFFFLNNSLKNGGYKQKGGTVYYQNLNMKWVPRITGNGQNYSSAYSILESDILNMLGIVPTISLQNKVVSGLSNFWKNPNIRHSNFNKSLQQACQDKSGEELKIIYDLMIHALDLRLWEKIRIEEKNKSLGIPPPDSETHDKFYNNLITGLTTIDQEKLGKSVVKNKLKSLLFAVKTANNLSIINKDIQDSIISDKKFAESTDIKIANPIIAAEKLGISLAEYTELQQKIFTESAARFAKIRAQEAAKARSAAESMLELASSTT